MVSEFGVASGQEFFTVRYCCRQWSPNLPLRLDRNFSRTPIFFFNLATTTKTSTIYVDMLAVISLTEGFHVISLGPFENPIPNRDFNSTDWRWWHSPAGDCLYETIDDYI
jgi:hypothetical protein